MSIHQAFQLAHSSPQFGGSYFDRAHGSNQILSHRLIPILERERAALAVQQSAQASFGHSSDSLPFAFTGLLRQLAGVCAALLG